jgi:hypothetical protein
MALGVSPTVVPRHCHDPAHFPYYDPIVEGEPCVLWFHDRERARLRGRRCSGAACPGGYRSGGDDTRIAEIQTKVSKLFRGCRENICPVHQMRYVAWRIVSVRDLQRPFSVGAQGHHRAGWATAPLTARREGKAALRSRCSCRACRLLRTTFVAGSCSKRNGTSRLVRSPLVMRAARLLGPNCAPDQHQAARHQPREKHYRR